jgi:HEAT repeat protein
MAARLSVDDKLAAIRKLRGQPLSPEHKAELRKYIGDRSNLVVAAAAAIAGENTLVELAKELEGAFDRFLVDPVKNDKLCRAKIAVVQALDKLEHQKPEVFQKAASHVQLEPVWGGSEDTAAPLRAAAIIALARIEGSSSLPLLVDAMVDPAKDVRIAAAMAMGALGTEAAGLLLRLKARHGDRDPEVLSECLSGLLAVNPRENLPIVTEFLEPSNAARCESAALALGKSRLPEAVDPLKACWQRSFSSEVRQQVLLALAMLRLPVAMDYLIDLVASDSEKDAIAALSALKIHNYDPRLRERLAPVVQKTGSPVLQARFDRDFPSDER